MLTSNLALHKSATGSTLEENDMRYRRVLTVAVLGLTLVLAGCSNDETAESSGKGFNDTDIAFATDMIQHHAQALQMVDFTMGKDLDPEVQQLADEIRAAQSPEIELMADWLLDWDQPVPETVRDHANAHSEGMDMNSDMPGMMSGEDLQSLEQAEGTDFQQMWLEMMIEHHEGAIEMADEEQQNGEDPQAIALAEDIAAAQAEEVSTMKNLLGQ